MTREKGEGRAGSGRRPLHNAAMGEMGETGLPGRWRRNDGKTRLGRLAEPAAMVCIVVSHKCPTMACYGRHVSFSNTKILVDGFFSEEKYSSQLSA